MRPFFFLWAVLLMLASTAHADQHALALLNRCADATQKTQALSADFTYSVTTGGKAEQGTGTLRLLKPNFTLIVYHTSGSERTRTVLCDGKQFWDIHSPENFAVRTVAAPADLPLTAPGGLLLRSFFSFYAAVKALDASPKLANLRMAGTETVDGETCRMLEDAAPDGTKTRLDIGPDGLLRREAVQGTDSEEITLSHVQRNPALTAKDFAFAAPPGPRLALADVKSLALLERVQARSAKTLTADWRFTVHKGDSETADYGKLRLMKPNYAAIGFDKDTPFGRDFLSDGSTLWTAYAPSGTYDKVPVEADGSNIDVEHIVPVAGFFDLYKALRQVCYFGPNIGLTYAGTEPAGDTLCQVIEYRVPGSRDGIGGVDRRFSIDPDGIVRRTSTRFMTGNALSSATAELTQVRVGEAMTAADFAYSPPEGTVASTLAADAPLLASGTIAPDFAEPSENGAPVHLSDFKGHPVVLVFWSTWWSSGPDILVQVGTLARKYSQTGVPVLAVHIWSTVDNLRQRLGKHPEYAGPVFLADTHRKGQDAGSRFYQVTDVPTEYVIGKDGKIAASFHGPQQSVTPLEDAVKAALKPAPTLAPKQEIKDKKVEP